MDAFLEVVFTKIPVFINISGIFWLRILGRHA